MSEDRLHRIEEIFYAAVPLPELERARFLERACGGDRELATDVETLLHHHDRGFAALDRPAMQLLASSQLRPGHRLGAYEIIRQIGSGGMGEVYEARDTRIDRRVALKVLSPAISGNPEFVERFWREVRIASALDHPNLVTIFDLGDIGGVKFLVSEFVEGVTLRQQLASGPIPFDQAVRIVREVGDALGVVHRVGVIHRDIKPENIMIRTDGSVRVLDFGLAKSCHYAGAPDKGLTQTGAVLGTWRYMSPEQVRGEDLDPRTDIWSLGALFFEMVTGRPPFDGPTPNHVAVAILEHEPQPPATLTGLFAKVLAKRREDRYASAAEFLAGIPSVVGAPQATRISWRLQALWGAAVVLLAALIWTGIFFYRHWGPAPVTVQMNKLVSLGTAGLAAISPDGRFLVYTTQGSGKQSLRLRQINTGTEAEVEPPSGIRIAGVNFSPDGGYIYYAAYGASNLATLYRSPLVGRPEKLTDNVDSPVTFSPDGQHIAFVRDFPTRGNNSVIVARSTAEDERVLATHKNPSYFSRAGPAWSPDGKHIAVGLQPSTGRDMNISIVDADTGRETGCGSLVFWIGRVTWPTPKELIVTAMGDRLQNSQIFRMEYPRCSLAPITADVSTYLDVTAAQHGRVLAAVRRDWLQYLSVMDSGASRQVTHEVGPYRGIAWADGGLLSEFGGELFRFGLDGSSTRLSTPRDAVDGARPCGNYVVGSSTRGGFLNIWRLTRDGRDAKELTFGPLDDRDPECTPDGRTVVFQSGRSGKHNIWSVPIDGGEPTQLTHVLSEMPAVSPDGSRIACFWKDAAGDPWRIAVLPVAGGNPVRVFDGLPARIPFRWHPSGLALTYADTKDGVSNLWQFDIASGAVHQVTRFEQDQMFAHDWSGDGRLACIRGTANANVVSLELK